MLSSPHLQVHVSTLQLKVSQVITGSSCPSFLVQGSSFTWKMALWFLPRKFLQEHLMDQIKYIAVREVQTQDFVSGRFCGHISHFFAQVYSAVPQRLARTSFNNSVLCQKKENLFLDEIFREFLRLQTPHNSPCKSVQQGLMGTKRILPTPEQETYSLPIQLSCHKHTSLHNRSIKLSSTLTVFAHS